MGEYDMAFASKCLHSQAICECKIEEAINKTS